MTNELKIKCPICKDGDLKVMEHKGFLGIGKHESLFCIKCLTELVKKDENYKLVKTSSEESDIWKEYTNKTLTLKEWRNIANGGMSDAKQREYDMELWLGKITSGNIKIELIGAESPIMLQPDEKAVCVIPNITLKEPRAIRKSSGSYGGPSFRITKGVSWRLGSFGSTSESYQQIRDIDKGTLIITNERFIFAGTMKTISLNLNKILQIDPFTDGVGLHRDGREKTQYFLWSENVAKIRFKEQEREYTEPFSGLIMKCLIGGLLKNS